MKLIDLLVQELPKSGGWPSGAKSCVQSAIDNEIYFYNKTYDGSGSMIVHRGKFYFPTADETGMDDNGLLMGSVSREQYESALAAQSVWNGEGLPPVGCECECMVTVNWFRCKIVYVSDKCVVLKYGESEEAWSPSSCQFRPIRTEAERKREDAIEALRLDEAVTGVYITEDEAAAIYDAIAAGEIPGVKLE